MVMTPSLRKCTELFHSIYIACKSTKSSYFVSQLFYQKNHRFCFAIYMYGLMDCIQQFLCEEKGTMHLCYISSSQNLQLTIKEFIYKNKIILNILLRNLPEI